MVIILSVACNGLPIRSQVQGEWHWTVYILVSRMYGLFQTSFYFGYMALFSAALGIMCGESEGFFNHCGPPLLSYSLWFSISFCRHPRLCRHKLLCKENLLNCENWLDCDKDICVCRIYLWIMYYSPWETNDKWQGCFSVNLWSGSLLVVLAQQCQCPGPRELSENKRLLDYPALSLPPKCYSPMIEYQLWRLSSGWWCHASACELW